MDAVRITRYIAAAIFALFGAMKFIMPSSPEQFVGWGYPDWFGYVTGVLELSAALLLVLPQTVFFGGVLGALIMVGAAVTHFRVPEVGLLPLGIPLLIACSWVAWKTRPQPKSS